MATAKIATLAIRTLAKPIATQIKHQAQSHQRFRAVCISLAQFMHRTEMALRTNLLASAASSDGEKPKVRPLNEAKAVTNGANALAEGFLFALAAALIMGESYRSSRSRAKQRDRTEEGLEEMRLVVQAMAERVGIDYEELQQKVREAQSSADEEQAKQGHQKEVRTDDEVKKQDEEVHIAHAKSVLDQKEADRRERDRLQHAVNVLLRLALKSGWIQGAEALHLENILNGTDEVREGGKESASAQSQESSTASPSPSTQQPQPSAILSQINQLRRNPFDSAEPVR